MDLSDVIIINLYPFVLLLIYCYLIYLPISIFRSNWYKGRHLITKTLISVLIGLYLLFFSGIGFLNCACDNHWHTQQIIYKNKNNPLKRIELQMRDTGALGYASRKVEMVNLGLISIVKKELKDIKKLDKNIWDHVYIEVNEMDLEEY